MLGELVFRRGDGEPLLAGGHGGEPLPHADRVGQVFVVPLLHHRLVVVEIHLRGTADHVQVNDVLHLRWKMRKREFPRGIVTPQFHRTAKQRSKGGVSERVFTAAEELAAGFVTIELFKQAHGFLLI